MLHSQSHPSWVVYARRVQFERELQRRIAISTLAVSLLIVAVTVWLVVTYL